MEILDTFSDLPSANYYTYPLEWLDLMVNFNLNPARSNLEDLDSEQLDRIIEILPKEEAKVLLLIKKQTFAVADESSVRLTIERYHSTLISLLDAALENARSDSGMLPRLQPIFKSVISTIDNLLLFLEADFLKYIHMDLRVPSTYLAMTRKELAKKIDVIKSKADKKGNLRQLKGIIFETLYKYTIPSDRNLEITFRSLFYNKELIRQLEDIEWLSEEGDLLNQISDVLFYMNFNSRSYIDYMISMVGEKAAGQDTVLQAVEKLHYYSKLFKQTHKRPGIVLNPDYHDLENVLQKWIESEIKYLEEKGRLDQTALSQASSRLKAKAVVVTEENKILCTLSSDQIGLILRAADEQRILVARSMTEVFRRIVPHLSTPHNENLSYNGMRSKSYTAEQRDKEKAIEALEKMIKKIKDY